MITALTSTVTCLQHSEHKWMAETRNLVLVIAELINKLTQAAHGTLLPDTRESLPQSEYISLP